MKAALKEFCFWYWLLFAELLSILCAHVYAGFRNKATECRNFNSIGKFKVEKDIKNFTLTFKMVKGTMLKFNISRLDFYKKNYCCITPDFCSTNK